MTGSSSGYGRDSGPVSRKANSMSNCPGNSAQSNVRADSIDCAAPASGAGKKFEVKPGHILAGLLAVATVVIFIFAYKSCNSSLSSQSGTGVTQQSSVTDSGSGIKYDTGAVKGGWTVTDQEKIVEELNAKVDEGMINISMNTSPYFTDGFYPFAF